jgi:hypothetical protein
MSYVPFQLDSAPEREKWGTTGGIVPLAFAVHNARLPMAA